jgi:hypothetical protein
VGTLATVTITTTGDRRNRLAMAPSRGESTGERARFGFLHLFVWIPLLWLWLWLLLLLLLRRTYVALPVHRDFLSFVHSFFVVERIQIPSKQAGKQAESLGSFALGLADCFILLRCRRRGKATTLNGCRNYSSPDLIHNSHTTRATTTILYFFSPIPANWAFLPPNAMLQLNTH